MGERQGQPFRLSFNGRFRDRLLGRAGELPTAACSWCVSRMNGWGSENLSNGT